MSKNYYEILEIDKNVAQDDIKKSYRNLSLKWHPDKWASKSESERKQAEEKFKEINKAYQILSDPETRNMYDIYGEDFESMGFGGNDTSSNADEIRREYAEAETKKQELKKQMLTVQMQSLSILLVIDEFMEYIWITENDLDSSLWSPCSNWKEKIRSLPFEEIDSFREKMIKTIQEVGKGKKTEPVKEDISVKNDAIKRVEDLLKRRSVKIEELEPINRNYKEAINNAGESVEEILRVEMRIQDDIDIKEKERNNNQTGQQEEYNYRQHTNKGWWWGRK